jgi:hypothetical protein
MTGENGPVDESKLEQEPILLNYAYCLNLLRLAIDGLQGAEVDHSRRQGEWTIREIMHHVADGDYLWKTCILRALGNCEGPFHLKWYRDTDQVRWSHLWQYASREIETSFALLGANRNHTIELLTQIPGSLSRSITIEWPEGGRQVATIAWILEMQTNHVEGHAREIRGMREARGI